MKGSKYRNQLRHPCLAGKFFARRHSTWGAAVCWHEWNDARRYWMICWGIGCKTLHDAKQLRKFLNDRVAVFPGDYGILFEDVCKFVRCVNSRR